MVATKVKRFAGTVVPRIATESTFSLIRHQPTLISVTGALPRCCACTCSMRCRGTSCCHSSKSSYIRTSRGWRTQNTAQVADLSHAAATVPLPPDTCRSSDLELFVQRVAKVRTRPNYKE